MTSVLPRVRALDKGVRRWSLLGGVVVSGILLFLLLKNVNGAQLRWAFRQVVPEVLIAALISKAVGFWVAGLRTRWLLGPLANKLSKRHASIAALLGSTVNNVLPLRAGEIFRLHYLTVRADVPHSSILVIMVFERLLDTITLIALFSIGLMLAGTAAPALPTGILMIGAACTPILLLIVLKSQRALTLKIGYAVMHRLGSRTQKFLAPKLEAIANGVDALGSVRRVVAAGALSLCMWGLAAFGVQVWFWAFGLVLPVHAPLVVLGFLAFGTALPSAPGFVGAYHYFVALALTSVYGVDTALAATVALVGHAVVTVPSTLVGLPLLVAERRILVRGSPS